MDVQQGIVYGKWVELRILDWEVRIKLVCWGGQILIGVFGKFVELSIFDWHF